MRWGVVAISIALLSGCGYTRYSESVYSMIGASVAVYCRRSEDGRAMVALAKEGSGYYLGSSQGSSDKTDALLDRNTIDGQK